MTSVTITRKWAQSRYHGGTWLFTITARGDLSHAPFGSSIDGTPCSSSSCQGLFVARGLAKRAAGADGTIHEAW